MKTVHGIDYQIRTEAEYLEMDYDDLFQADSELADAETLLKKVGMPDLDRLETRIALVEIQMVRDFLDVLMDVAMEDSLTK